MSDLHDTDFLRQQYFKVRTEILNSIKSIRLPDSNNHYLLGRQRGQFSGYAEVLESKMPRIKTGGAKGLESRLPEYQTSPALRLNADYLLLGNSVGIYSDPRLPNIYDEPHKSKFNSRGTGYKPSSGLEYML